MSKIHLYFPFENMAAPTICGRSSCGQECISLFRPTLERLPLEFMHGLDRSAITGDRNGLCVKCVNKAFRIWRDAQ